MSNEPEVRVGTAERETAQSELNEHFSQGRLDVTEFEERSSVVAGARTRAELENVFGDLPRSRGVQVPAQKANRNWQYSVIAVMPIAAVVLFFVALQGVWDQSWLVFLLVPAAGALFGAGGHRDRGRDGRERRRNRD